MKKTAAAGSPLKVEAKDQSGVPPTPALAAQSTSVQSASPLTSEEKQRLAKLEKVIDAKLAGFFEVGSAIMEIKSKELFRETHKNFNVYCQERWGFGRSYANKLIGSAERIQLLPQHSAKPANEFQIRPFLKLEPEEFPKKWQAIVDAAGTGKVTSKIVEDSLDLAKKNRRKRKSKTTYREERLPELLGGLRSALKEKNVDEAMKQLTELERLLME